MAKGWIGVDLDATLAYYEKWVGVDHIGEPIPRMVERVKEWLAEGKKVKVMTARISPMSIAISQTTHKYVEKIIQDWTEKHVGVRLPVTHEKDLAMIELWDDRAIQVVPNTGERVGDMAASNGRKSSSAE